MKTKFIHTLLFAFISLGNLFAQDVTTVRANNSDISDNLNLQAVASIFGDSRDLEDFERRLNDPDMQISNLDLNGDNRVDYLRVVELTQNNVHVIVLQAVLGVDNFQDVATIEVERDRNNNVSVQVVGDAYMYGPNYIYEPVYVTRPALFSLFWVNTYRPYYSPWYWDYYPTYYNYWAPCPAYRYHNHVNVYVNNRNTYNYVSTGRSRRAANLYAPRRSNYYEKQNPGRSFTNRNQNVTNRHELEQSRANTYGTRGGSRGTLNSGSRSNEGLTNSRGIKDVTTKPSGSSFSNSTRSNTENTVRTTRPSRSFDNGSSRSNSTVRSSIEPSANVGAPVRQQSVQPSRSYSTPVRQQSAEPTRQFNVPVRQQNSEPSRQYSAPVSAPAQIQTPRQSAPVQMQSTPRQSAPMQMQSAPSAPRQSAPSMSRGGGNNGGGGSRRG